MKCITTLTSMNEWAELKQNSSVEVILSPIEWSRFGQMPLAECCEILSDTRNRLTRIFLQIDGLWPEREFHALTHQLESLNLDGCDGIRVQDAGLARTLQSQLPGLDLHFIAEAGYRNSTALQTLCEVFHPSLKRLVLSSEVPGATLAGWLKQIPVETERLVLGPLLLLATPRPLLRANLPESSNRLFPLQTRENGPPRSFSAFENRWGTYLFHEKHLSLCAHWQALAQMGLSAGRIDRFFPGCENTLPEILDFLNAPEGVALEKLQAAWPAHKLQGFYAANKTDSRFYQLKNPVLQEIESPILAEVIETERKKYTVIRCRSPLKEGQEVLFVTPDGFEFDCLLPPLHTITGTPLREAGVGSLVKLPHFRKVSRGTLLLSGPS